MMEQTRFRRNLNTHGETPAPERLRDEGVARGLRQSAEHTVRNECVIAGSGEGAGNET